MDFARLQNRLFAYNTLSIHARVRATAVAALGDLNGSHAVNIISQALRDPDPEVRERATELLEELNDDALFHALYPAL
jgi:HEAT repeat protein